MDRRSLSIDDCGYWQKRNGCDAPLAAARAFAPQHHQQQQQAARIMHLVLSSHASASSQSQSPRQENHGLGAEYIASCSTVL